MSSGLYSKFRPLESLMLISDYTDDLQCMQRATPGQAMPSNCGQRRDDSENARSSASHNDSDIFACRMSLCYIRRGGTPPSFPLHEHSLGRASVLFLCQSSSLSSLFRLLPTLRLLHRNRASKIVYSTERSNPEVGRRRRSNQLPILANTPSQTIPDAIAHQPTLLMNTLRRISGNPTAKGNPASKAKRKTTYSITLRPNKRSRPHQKTPPQGFLRKTFGYQTH
jgi:hypothetical protein